MENTKEETQRKLNDAKSKLVELDKALDGILIQLSPLELKRDKIQGDRKYFQGRIEKLTKRIMGV